MSAVASKLEWETRAFDAVGPVELGDDKRFRGYPIVFNALSEKLRDRDGSEFREIVRPSAVDRTLREGLDVRAYIDHDTGKILGRSRAGTLMLRKDTRGLRAEISPPKTTYAKDLAVSMDRGDVSGMSFRFRVAPGGQEWNMVDGELIRELTDLIIGEVSIVTEPAYPDTEVAYRSLREFQETIKAQFRPSPDFLRRVLKAKS